MCSLSLLLLTGNVGRAEKEALLDDEDVHASTGHQGYTGMQRH